MNKYTEDSINTERIYYMVKGGEIYECKIKQLVFEIPNPISVNYFFNERSDLDINRFPIFSIKVETPCKTYYACDEDFRNHGEFARIYPYLDDCTSSSDGIFFRDSDNHYWLRPRIFVKDFMKRFKPPIASWVDNGTNVALMTYYWDYVNLRTVYTRFMSRDVTKKRSLLNKELLFDLSDGKIILNNGGRIYYSSFEECEKNKDKVVIHRF